MELTQREKMIVRLEKEYNITIIFNNEIEKTVLCNRCKENMANFDIIIDEHTEFECLYCGKNIKLPLYLWDFDLYIFPNKFYPESQRCVIVAQCLAKAYNKAYQYTKESEFIERDQ